MALVSGGYRSIRPMVAVQFHPLLDLCGNIQAFLRISNGL